MTDYASILDIKQRRLAFLDDTAKDYTVNNRAIKDRICVYSRTDTSPGCAIGRHLHLDVAYEFDSIGSIAKVAQMGRLHLIPVWMQEMGVPFLTYVQSLHDTNIGLTFWDDKGLTKHGKNEYEQIKKSFCV